MDRPKLMSNYLLQRGFERVARWQVSGNRLAPDGPCADRAGVYAFAIDGEVQYVGVATVSLHKRLGFYGNPAASQSTNIRLNALIRAAIEQGDVEILIACPPDSDWNQLPVKGAPGLEAGLIANFSLPWNKRGALSPLPPRPAAADAAIISVGRTVRSKAISAPNSAAPVEQRVLAAIRERAEMTELQIAQRLFGCGAAQQQVNPSCRVLLRRGLIVRIGAGGVSDPFRYRAKA